MESVNERLIAGSIMPLILESEGDYLEYEKREPEVPFMRRVLQACGLARP
jgi:hypothetical protein